jgi:hypothetical protein
MEMGEKEKKKGKKIRLYRPHGDTCPTIETEDGCTR